MNYLSKKQIIAMCIIAIPFVIISIYNIIKNDNYFSMTFTSALSTYAVISVSFYLTQIMNDNREKRQQMNDLLKEISRSINTRELFFPETQEEMQASLILQRSVGNKINILKSYKLKGEALDSLEKLMREYEHARNLYGNHSKSAEAIREVKIDFTNSIEIMDNCCDKIKSQLY